MRLNFHIQGDGPPLIILHGFLGSLDNWRTMSKRFAAHYRVFAVDLRNHGGSPHSEFMNYSIMAQDLEEFVDSHEIDAANVMGHSMGGKVAMQFAMNTPARINKLVIVDIAPKAYPPTHRSLLTALRHLDIDALTSFAAADQALLQDVADNSLRQFLVKNLVRNSDGRFCWRIGLDAIIASYDELTQAVVPGAAFENPVLFLRAGNSTFIEGNDLAAIRAIFRRAEIRTIDGAGHWLHIEAPDAFYQVIIDFLGEP